MGKLYEMEQQRLREEPKKPFRPPRVDDALAALIDVPGVIYKWDDATLGVRIRRRRGRTWLWTGLTEELLVLMMPEIREHLKAIVRRWTNRVGVTITLMDWIERQGQGGE